MERSTVVMRLPPVAIAVVEGVAVREVMTAVEGGRAIGA